MHEVFRIFGDFRPNVKRSQNNTRKSVSSLAMRQLILITSLAILAAACTSNDPLASSTTSSTALSETSLAITTTSADPPQQDDSPCLAGDRPFADSGVISAFGGTTGDATQISGIRWAGHPGCERVVVDVLTADGAPAGSLGTVGVDYDEVLGIIRVNLPTAIARTAIADVLIDGELIDRAYVVRTTAGGLAVDIHVTVGSSVALRSFEVDAPSRIVVDVRPEPNAPGVVGATISRDMVVLSPLAGPVATPLVVAGYTRAFESLVIAQLHEDRDSEPIDIQTALAADWAEVWGEFTLTFNDPPPQTKELFVGSESPSTGDLDGVWVAVDGSGPTAPPPDV
jgi:hypothetical protein